MIVRPILLGTDGLLFCCRNEWRDRPRLTLSRELQREITPKWLRIEDLSLLWLKIVSLSLTMLTMNLVEVTSC